MNADQLLNNIVSYILNPIIALLFSVGLLIFFWGIVEFIRNAENEDSRKTGTQHMLYGVIGMFIMVAAKGIIAIIKNTIGV